MNPNIDFERTLQTSRFWYVKVEATGGDLGLGGESPEAQRATHSLEGFRV